MYTLAQLLRKHRMEKGFSQKQMALHLKISPPAYSKYENGKTKFNVQKIKEFAQVLQISVHDFLNTSEIGENAHDTNQKPTENTNDNPNNLVHLGNKMEALSEKMLFMLQNQNELMNQMLKMIKKL